jgi:hypothetical protein
MKHVLITLLLSLSAITSLHAATYSASGEGDCTFEYAGGAIDTVHCVTMNVYATYNDGDAVEDVPFYVSVTRFITDQLNIWCNNGSGPGSCDTYDVRSTFVADVGSVESGSPMVRTIDTQNIEVLYPNTGTHSLQVESRVDGAIAEGCSWGVSCTLPSVLQTRLSIPITIITGTPTSVQLNFSSLLERIISRFI